MLQCRRKNALAQQFGGIGMHKESTTLTNHNAVRVGIGLYFGYGFRYPLHRDISRECTHIAALRILHWSAVRCNNLLGIDILRVEICKRLNPHWLIQQFGSLIPVHIMIVVGGITFLSGVEFAIVVKGIGREIMALIGEIVGFESYRTTIQIRVTGQYATRIHKHRVGHIQMSQWQPHKVVGCYLYTLHQHVYTLHRVIQHLGRTVQRLLAHSLTRLYKQESK